MPRVRGGWRAKTAPSKMRRAVRTTRACGPGASRTTRRPDFHIVEYSIQDNHLHMIVEAESRDALARGMKSFSVRANRLFNSAVGRGRGRVWGDRYHRRDLSSPRQVRHALVYCLNNYKKHYRVPAGSTPLDHSSRYTPPSDPLSGRDVIQALACLEEFVRRCGQAAAPVGMLLLHRARQVRLLL